MMYLVSDESNQQYQLVAYNLKNSFKAATKLNWVFPKRCAQVLVQSTCECDIWKLGLCRCYWVKWGHTRLGWSLIQWMVTFIRTGKFGQRETQRRHVKRRPCDNGSWNWSDAAASQGEKEWQLPLQAKETKELFPRDFRMSKALPSMPILVS